MLCASAWYLSGEAWSLEAKWRLSRVTTDALKDTFAGVDPAETGSRPAVWAFRSPDKGTVSCHLSLEPYAGGVLYYA